MQPDAQTRGRGRLNPTQGTPAPALGRQNGRRLSARRVRLVHLQQSGCAAAKEVRVSRTHAGIAGFIRLAFARATCLAGQKNSML